MSVVADGEVLAFLVDRDIWSATAGSSQRAA
jgi:hypothetical protein